MHLVLLLSILAATVHLTAAALLMLICRAPGWRSARTFAWVAFTAGLYSVCNIITAEQGLPDIVYSAATRLNYLWATLHIVSWFPWLLGGPDAEWRPVPRPLKALALLATLLAFVALSTDVHLLPGLRVFTIEWAHVTYHFLRPNAIGEAYAAFIGSMLLIPFGIVASRALRGDRAWWPLCIGFVIYLVAAALEVMVANGQLYFISPGDIGFLAVIMPTSWMLISRFINDAHRLQSVTGDLRGEVQQATEELDRAHHALLESERLAALGQLAAGVGHEINNPLTYLQLALDRVHHFLHGQRAPHDVTRAIEDARDGAWRIQKVVEGLRTYSRRESERAAVDLNEVARNALKVAQPRLRHIAMLETQLAEVPVVLAEEPRLVQALVNLLVNAAQAVSEHGANGRIRLSSGVTGTGDAYLEVEDDGPGIPAEIRARIAEPYFTTRGPSGGAGLGFFVTRGIVDAHHGRIVIEDVQPHGARVRIELPPAPAGVTPRSLPPTGPPAPVTFDEPTGDRPRPRLLAVDDEPMLLRLLAHMLRDEWDVTEATHGEQAEHLLATQEFDVVLCDLMMPGYSGMQLASRAVARDPDLRGRMVFMTGGAITPEAEAFVADPNVVTVNKPMDFAALRALLRETAVRARQPR